MWDQLSRPRSGSSSLRAGPFDVGVRQGPPPPPPLHTRAHARTRTRITLCRQGSGGSKVTDSLPRSPSSVLSRIYPLLPYSRARSLELPRPGRGAPGRGASLPFHASLLRSATRGRGAEEEEEAAGGRREAGRAHSPRDAQRAQSCLRRRAPPCRPMLCSMANSGCLLLSNSGSMLPHSVPCPPAFLYLQQVSGPRPPGRRTCAPRRRPHPHLAASAAPPGPRCAPRVMAPGPGGGSCAPARWPSAGSLEARAAPGGGPEFGASLSTFPKAREGSAGGVSGEARGEGAGVLSVPVTLGNFAAGCRGHGAGSRARRWPESGKPGGRAAAAAAAAAAAVAETPSSTAARTARWASGEAGHPPGGAG